MFCEGRNIIKDGERVTTSDGEGIIYLSDKQQKDKTKHQPSLCEPLLAAGDLLNKDLLAWFPFPAEAKGCKEATTAGMFRSPCKSHSFLFFILLQSKPTEIFIYFIPSIPNSLQKIDRDTYIQPPCRLSLSKILSSSALFSAIYNISTFSIPVEKKIQETLLLSAIYTIRKLKKNETQDTENAVVEV